MTKRKGLFAIALLTLLALSMILANYSFLNGPSSQVSAQPPDVLNVHSTIPTVPTHMDFAEDEPIHMSLEDTPPGPVHMDLVDPTFNPQLPISTEWHEIYPEWCTPWHLRSWHDNGDEVLSPSDQIDMYNPTTGEVRWFHLDKITTTLFWTEKDYATQGVVELVEPTVPPGEPITDPITTEWHQVWPTYCHKLHITSWNDNGDRQLSPSDQIDMLNQTDGAVRWYHVDRVSVDIILTPKGPIDDPITTKWHELYPNYCNMWHLTSWEDNGDGVLSPSDQIDMTNLGTDETFWYHIEEVTTTIHLSSKVPPTFTAAFEVIDPALFNRAYPITSDWHEIYPNYCVEWHLTSWEDNGDGVLSPSDQIDMTDPAGNVVWWHVDRITTDIILKKKTDLGNPVTTKWHELYPNYCNPWHLTSWVDNGDNVLSPSDQIDMTNELTGEVVWFHVDRITTTMFWTEKQEPITGVVELITPLEPAAQQITNPISTDWHQVWPIYCPKFHITSWIDNGDGVLSASDQIDMTDENGVTRWYHVDRVSIDIILTPKGPIDDPITTEWHELYPNYCNIWHLTSWHDNGDGVLSPSDQIDMKNLDGEVFWYHIDDITTTIHVTPKETGHPMYIDLIGPRDLTNPVSTDWHELYPVYSNKYHLLAWVDNGDGVLSPSDQILLMDTVGFEAWYHVDEMAVDLLLTRKVENHDVAVIDVTPWKQIVGQGFTLKINVTVRNEGDFIETFTTTAYADLIVPPIADEIIIGAKVTTLNPGASTVLLYQWTTTNVPKGNYTISAIATPVPGEIDIADNTYIDKWVIVAMVGDVTGTPDGWPDGKVDIKDIAAIAKCYGQNIGDPGYVPNYDLNCDGKIDIKDIAAAAKNYGQIDP